MSLGSTLVKSAVLIGLMAGLGYSINNSTKANQQLSADKTALASVTAQYNSEKNKKPSVKKVTTDYQKAINVAKNFAAADAIAQKATKVKDADAALKTLRTFVSNPDDLNGPLIAGELKDWYLKPVYGGENSNGQITMAFNVLNSKNELMGMYTFYYNIDSGKLSGFINYPTYVGSKIAMKALRG